jgi:hypothetical protein
LGLYLTFALLLLLCAALTITVHAQTGTAPAPATVDIVTKIGLIATLVATVLQGIKKFVPALGGSYAVVLNFILSLALAYAASPSLDVQFFIRALGAAFAAAGIHSFLRPAGIISTASPFAPGKGS